MNDPIKKLLNSALSGALAGAAQATGVAPGAAHSLVARTLQQLNANVSAVEFVARAMHAFETNDAAGWATMPEVTRKLWRTRARSAFHAIASLSTNAAQAAYKNLGDPQALADLVQEFVKSNATSKSRR